MSLINNANPGSQINLMLIIYRVLNRAAAPMKKELLIGLCSPDTLSINDDQRKRLPGELRFWADPLHQLWTQDAEDTYSLVHSFAGGDPTPSEISAVVRQLLMGIDMTTLFDPHDDADGVAKLMTFLSCLLAAPDFSPLSGQELSKEKLAELQRKYLPTESHLSASNELSEVITYGHFLGFLEPGEKGGYIIDPTVAVFKVLKDEFEQGQDVGVRDCLTKLAEKLPILDGGNFREEVEEKMVERGFSPPSNNRLSTTMSHALYRLRIAGVIKLEELSDDPNQLIFDLPNGEKKFSRVRLLATEG